MPQPLTSGLSPPLTIPLTLTPNSTVPPKKLPFIMQGVILSLMLSAIATANANWIRIAPPSQTGLVSCGQGLQPSTF